MITKFVEMDERAVWGKWGWERVVKNEPRVKLCRTPTWEMERENEPVKETKGRQKEKDTLESMDSRHAGKERISRKGSARLCQALQSKTRPSLNQWA